MSNNEWLRISQQLHDELNVIKRDALVPYVIAKTDGVENERDLYEQLLIDVEMGSCGKTSKVGEAIAAAQLYFHRYFVNLENVPLSKPEDTKRTLKTYWQWMKNYRVWEANRKVFLYPENYIRPELRDTKTPAFKALEDDLMQGEITAEAAQRVYQKYLDEYTEVSRLTIAGGYVYDSEDTSNKPAKSLVLFGRTKTDPRRYYYRTAQFLGKEKATTWSPWLKVNVQIDADKVYPVFAFDRIFVFWVKVETISENPNSTALTTTETLPAQPDPESKDQSTVKSQTVKSTPQSATHVLRIFYSFYNLNKEWMPAQTFRPKDDNAEKIEVKIPAGIAVKDIKNIGLLVETSKKLSVPLNIPGSAADGEHENIIVQCTYEVPVTEYDLVLSSSLAKKPLPESGERLFAIGKDPQGRLSFRGFNHQEKQVIDVPESALDLTNLFVKVTLDWMKIFLWFYWDGAFPLTPESKKFFIDAAMAIIPNVPIGFADDQMPPRPAADEPRSIVCHRTFSLTPELYTVKLWNQPPFENRNQGVFRSIFNEPDITADQMVTFNTFQQSSEGPWFSFDYKGGSFLCKPVVDILNDDQWPKYISINTDGLPKGSLIDAAVQLPNHKTFFFRNTQGNTNRRNPQSYVAATTFPGEFAADQPIVGHWGRVNNHIQSTGIVDAAYVDRTSRKTYLFSGNQYVVYSMATVGETNAAVNDYEWVDEGYPQQIAANASFPNWPKIDAVFQGKDNKTYFFNNTNQIYRISGDATDRSIKADWGIVKNSPFIEGFTRSADDAGEPSIDAAFVYNNATYLIHRNEFIKYTGSDYSLIDVGYPKPHNLLDLLIDLGYNAAAKSNQEKENLRREKVVAAYNRGNTVYLYTRAERNNYEYKDGKLTLLSSKDEWTAGFAIDSVVYQFSGRQLSVSNVQERFTLNHNINAAFVGADDRIYIFRQNDYISFAKAGLTVQSLVDRINAWRNSQTNLSKWGKVGDNIARTGRIDAAFCDGEKTYLFSGDEYLLYSGDTYAPSAGNYPDEGYPKKLNTNTDRLPKWEKMDTVLATMSKTGAKGDIYFFNNSDQTYVQSGNLRSKNQTRAKWGRVRNNIVAQGIVDAAFVKGDASGNYLFLTSGDQIFRYKIDPTGANPEPILDPTLSNFVDWGYPKQFTWDRLKIDAAFSLGGKTLLVAGNHYCRLAELQNGELQELTNPPKFKPLHRNWGNLPKDLMSGLDGAFNVPREGNVQDLYLFQGDRYFKYDTQNEKHGQPYELEDVLYEIVRLTTSTAYRLNQALFAGGLPQLLSLATQKIDDTPSFSLDRAEDIPPNKIATTIRVKPEKVNATKLPSSASLDFSSANGLYYWEIFFHAPFLIAQALNLAQQFETAKTWYEYIYDPMGIYPYWKFLPFEQNTDLPTFEGVDEALIDAYLTDPFDPHAIARLRPMAYRKAIVMAYLDNLLDWGDMLFQQYTRESINEARMLYILAYDLLGTKPENLGPKILSEDLRYAELAADAGPQRSNQLVGQQSNQRSNQESNQQSNQESNQQSNQESNQQSNQESNQQSNQNAVPETIHLSLRDLTTGDRDYDFLVYPSETTTIRTPHASVTHPYFFVPENTVLMEYWDRVEDRLYKIRHCLNILGISQPLPLFEPPIDPMALVRAVSTGAGLSSALASLNVPVPHYRFDFMIRKAQELAQKLSQFGNDLLGALEKKDAEELSLLQNRQEGIILNLTRSIKAAQLEEAKYSRQALEESLASTTYQFNHYQGLLTTGLTALEKAQIDLMLAGSALMIASGGVKLGAAIVRALPEITIGLFSFGSTIGGEAIGEAIDKGAEAMETMGDGISMIGDAIGISAQHERSVQDWTLQKAMADSEIKQLKLQIQGAILQEQVAQREIEILEQQIAHNESVSTYMRDKFSNAQLYQWMASKLSGLYYQTYQMAFDMAKAAEKAFQFERGMKESEASFINGPYWDSQRKGLLAGDCLGLDLDRMEKAYIDGNRRGFEITKAISLLDLDPVALLRLKTKGVCEFSLSESLFDYDFPGHYCRQIRTLSLAFDFGEAGQTVMATLTQLNHKTVLEPDPKAVKFLLDPKDQPPESLRNGWKASQQIALSHVEEGERNNGLFELRFDDNRYLPFENTGAVSTWRLELNGKKNSYNINALRDVVINLKYTAEQGGQVFASAVKGLLKPYPTARFIDVAQEFPEEWAAFLEEEDNDLVLPMSRELFPNMSSSKIAGIFASYDLSAPGNVSMVLNRDKNLTLKQGKFLQTTGLSISSRGSDWTFTVTGNKEIINTIGLVLSYKASVT